MDAGAAIAAAHGAHVWLFSLALIALSVQFLVG